MTTDQLERDLRTLAEPHADDERVHRAIRTTLGEQLHARPRRARRRRLAFGSAAVATAGLAAAIIAVVGTGESGGPASANAAILAHVATAISPPANMIVHVKETGVLGDGTQVGVEWWQATSQPYAVRLIKGPEGQAHEAAADGTTSYEYDAATNTVYEHPNPRQPTLIDPVENARAALTHGTAQVAGTVTIDGRSLYRVELPRGVVGYFDRSDYRPAYIDNPQGDGSIVRTEVVTYEELAPTTDNEKLLSITAQHPGARVKTSPAPNKP